MAININPALDIAYIDQAYGEDPVIIYLIFDAFLSDSLPRWHSLKQALETDDRKESASIVHGLKPSFTMTGLTMIRPRVEELERAIKTEKTAEQLLDMYSDIALLVNEKVPVLESESARLKSI